MRPTHLLRQTAQAATLVLGCAFGSEAFAHGGIPRAYEIRFEPGNDQHMMLRSDLWGFFDSKDGGKTWQYICAESWGGISSQLQNRSLAIMPGGRILIATFFGGIKYTDDLCSWNQVQGFEDQAVPIVAADPSGDSNLVAVTATGSENGIDGRFFKSPDRGETWAQVGGRLPSDFAASSIGFAPSEPKVAYLGGKVINAVTARVLQSRDGGLTWTQHELPIVREGWDPRIVLIDPENSDVVLIRVDGVEGYGEDIPDELWATTDGGATWRAIYVGAGDLPGTTLDPETRSLFVSGPLEGVQAAPISAALSAGQAAFKKTFDSQVYGIQATTEGLLLGGNNYTTRGIPAYTLGRSVDQGRTFEPLMTMCDIQLAECAPSTRVGEVCTDIWAGDVDSPGFKVEYIDVRCEGKPNEEPPVTDGGAPPVPAADSGDGASSRIKGGCGCRTDSGSGTGGVALCVAAGVAAATLRRRRSRRD